jgi:hypothetical protein
MFVVPQLWGLQAQVRNQSYMALLDREMEQKFRLYYEWVNKNPLIDGMLSWCATP